MASNYTQGNSAISWWELCAVPDVLLSENLLSEDKQARLTEHYQVWRSGIELLASHRDLLTVCLRFRADPIEGRLRAFVGIKYVKSQGRANDLSTSVLSLFTRLGAKLKPVKSNVKLVQEGITKALFPESVNPDKKRGEKTSDGIVHLCQWFGKHNWRAVQSESERNQADARWSIRPFGIPARSTSGLLSELLHLVLTADMESLCCLSFYLSPSTVTEAERQWLWNQARILQRDADLGPYSEDDPQKKLASPLLEIEARNIQFFASSLEPVFRSVAEVWVRSGDEETSGKLALQIAYGVASTIDLAQELPHSPAFPELLPGKCLVAEPLQAALDLQAKSESSMVDVEDLQRTLRGYAIEAYNDLDIRHWITFAYELQGENAVRVPYLVNSAGASVFFRLPVDMGGGLPGLRLRQAPPDFDPGEARQAGKPIFEEQDDEDSKPDDQPGIKIGQLHSGGCISINKDELTRHTLIVGNTGSGKTWTTKHILGQLDVPFLVIETAKKEYRSLLLDPRFCKEGQRPVVVFTPGSEGVVPIRLNPFELLPGVRVESHIGALLTCFEAALPLGGPLFAILEEALVQAYTSLGWRLEESITDSKAKRCPFPTMTWFSLHLSKIAESRGYEGDVRSNVRAAIGGRISPLTIHSGTSKGKLFDTHISYPNIAELFEQRAVVELNDLRAEEKSLVTMFLLVFLREYRESDLQRNLDPKKLRHITVIEEAHNVLASHQIQQSTEESPNTRSAAVERFSNMLTEMRSLGEGLIVADQSPHKILPDAIRNTNLQIVHQLRAGDDQKAVAASMVMSEEQERFLAKLRPGNAAVYFTGLERATFVKVPSPPILDEGAKKALIRLQDDRLLRNKSSLAADDKNGLFRDSPRNWAFRACLSCPELTTCPAQAIGARVLSYVDSNLRVFFENDIANANLDSSSGEKRAAAAIVQILKDHNALGEAASPVSVWCSLSHASDSLYSSLSKDGDARFVAERLAIQLQMMDFESIFLAAKKSM